MSVAFIFPGQGSQAVGMGKTLHDAFAEARWVFEAADDAMGMKLSALCFSGPEDQLKLTAHTQPAILAMSIATHAVFSKSCRIAPAFVAGHSLGEYSALVAAGAMNLQDAVRTVHLRGVFMQEAVPPGVGAMAAVLGLPSDEVTKICEDVAQGEVVSPANFNEPMQTVIAGHSTAVERAIEPLKTAGAKRVQLLPVSAPFHCALMQPVIPRLDAVLDRLTLQTPSAPIMSNVEAKPNANAARIKALLLEQVTSAVRWVDCVKTLQANGVTKFVEFGPGKVLCSLIKRIAKDLECTHVEDPVSLEKALKQLDKPST